MQKIQKTLYASVVASESIHIFCCVLPTVFSILSLLAGMGVVATLPSFLNDAHAAIHAYEIPMIMVSGLILLFGWGLYLYSRKIDCRNEGTCAHTPCEPKKNRTKIFMMLATILFVVNIMVYFAFHRGMDEHFNSGQSHDIVHHHGHAH